MSQSSTAARSLRSDAHRCAVSPAFTSDYPNPAAVSFNLHSFLNPISIIDINTFIKDNDTKQSPNRQVESGPISRRRKFLQRCWAGFNWTVRNGLTTPRSGSETVRDGY